MNLLNQSLVRAWPLLLFGFMSVFWGNFGQSFFIGVYSESFKQSLGLSATDYGSIYSLATLGAGFIFLFAGVWIDRLQLKAFAILAGTGLSVACVCLFLAKSSIVLFVGFLLVRLFGQGLLPHTGMVTMARHFDSNRGKALSIAASAVPVGEVLLPLFAVFLILVLGWRISWLVYASMIPLLYFPFAFYLLHRGKSHLVSEPTGEEKITAQYEINGRFDLLKSFRFWLIIPVLMYSPIVVTGVFIHQDYVIEQKAWENTLWAACFIAYGIVHWLSSVLVGVLIDRYSARKLLAWYNLPVILALLVLVSLSGVLPAFVFLGLLGVTIGFGGPIGAALWAELYGKKHLGGIRSMVSAFIVVATAVSPVIFGVVIDVGLAFSTIVYSTIVFGMSAVVASWFAFRVG